jgi:hypothetical protein
MLRIHGTPDGAKSLSTFALVYLPIFPSQLSRGQKHLSGVVR